MTFVRPESESSDSKRTVEFCDVFRSFASERHDRLGFLRKRCLTHLITAGVRAVRGQRLRNLSDIEASSGSHLSHRRTNWHSAAEPPNFLNNLDLGAIFLRKFYTTPRHSIWSKTNSTDFCAAIASVRFVGKTN